MTEKGAAQSIRDVDEVKTIDNYQTVQSKSKRRKHSNIVNFSNYQLITDEVSVLELVLSVCPTTKYLNTEQTTNAFYSFIRPLKVFQYFHENPNQQDSQDTANDVDAERDILD